MNMGKSGLKEAVRARFAEVESFSIGQRSLEERLKDYPELQAKIEATLGIIENAGGDVEKAAEAERRIIDEMRQMGNEVLHSWARRQQEKKEQEYNAQAGVNRRRKKNSTPYNKQRDWVFASAKLKEIKPLTPGMLRKWHLKPAAEKAGVSGKVGWHTFRRTLASLFIADGVDIKTVQESLHHSTSKITLDLYAQATTPNKLAALRKLIDAIVPKTQQPTILTGLNS
jgi:integrase